MAAFKADTECRAPGNGQIPKSLLCTLAGNLSWVNKSRWVSEPLTPPLYLDCNVNLWVIPQRPGQASTGGTGVICVVSLCKG